CSAVSGGRSASPAPVALCHSAMRHLSYFPSQLAVSQPATDNVAHYIDEAFNVRHVPIIVAEGLLIDITEQMEGFDCNVGPFQASFQQAPEFFAVVGVRVAVHICARMVDYLMRNFIQPVIRFQRIAVNIRSCLYVLPNKGLQFRLAAGYADLRANRSA